MVAASTAPRSARCVSLSLEARRILLALVGLLALAVTRADEPLYVELQGGPFVSALAGPQGRPETPDIAAFDLRAWPVSESEMANFLRHHRRWRRDRVSPLLASPPYLSAWPQADRAPADGAKQRSVTEVSWFAARAYCASEHARLPTWFEWEYAAAASRDQQDARMDAAHLQRILARTTGRIATRAQMHTTVQGIHGLYDGLWEWLDDQAALFPAADTRAPETGSNLSLCGGAALAFYRRQDYALILRASALQSRDLRQGDRLITFRCVRPRSTP